MPKPHHSISYRLDALPDAQPTVSKQWQQQQQALYSPLSGTTRVSWNQKKHSSTHHPDHHPIFMSFFHLLRSIANSLFKLRAWKSFCTTSLKVLFGLLFGLEPSNSYSIHLFTQSVSSFRNTCHTIATCFTVVSILYHLFLVFLSTPYLELRLSPHHYTSIWPFSSLLAEVKPHVLSWQAGITSV